MHIYCHLPTTMTAGGQLPSQQARLVCMIRQGDGRFTKRASAQPTIPWLLHMMESVVDSRPVHQTGRIRLNLADQHSTHQEKTDILRYNLPQILQMLHSQILLTLPIAHVRNHSLRPRSIDDRTRFQNLSKPHCVQRGPS
jgi:hypothetical protein